MGICHRIKHRNGADVYRIVVVLATTMKTLFEVICEELDKIKIGKAGGLNQESILYEYAPAMIKAIKRWAKTQTRLRKKKRS